MKLVCRNLALAYIFPSYFNCGPCMTICNGTKFCFVHAPYKDAPEVIPANISSNQISRLAELRLICGYVGAPAPDLQWIHNDSIALNSTSPGVSIIGGQPGDTTSSVVIAAVNRDSGGTYTCRASNSLGTAEVVYTVNILSKCMAFNLHYDSVYSCMCQ